MEKVKVQIDGMNFYVVGDEEADYIRNLAKELNEMYDATNRSNARLNQVQAQVLTTLNLLDQYKKLENRLEEVKNSSQDAQIASEKEAQIQELQEKLAGQENSNGSLKEENDQLREAKKGLEDDLGKVKETLKEREEEVLSLKGKLEEGTKKLEEISEKNYQAQLTITDLNKEISVLRGEA